MCFHQGEGLREEAVLVLLCYVCASTKRRDVLRGRVQGVKVCAVSILFPLSWTQGRPHRWRSRSAFTSMILEITPQVLEDNCKPNTQLPQSGMQKLEGSSETGLFDIFKRKKAVKFVWKIKIFTYSHIQHLYSENGLSFESGNKCISCLWLLFQPLYSLVCT